MSQERYVNFRAALRRLGSARRIAELLGVSERTAKYYLAGEQLPRADAVVPFPDLVEGLRRDIQQAEQQAA